MIIYGFHNMSIVKYGLIWCLFIYQFNSNGYSQQANDIKLLMVNN